MELRQLRYFVTVAEELHFGRAAERLMIVQSAVSQQIRRLERELGVELFDRSPRRVRLTEAGLRFLPAAREVLAAERAARAAVAEYAAERGGMLRVGTSSGMGVRLERVLGEFARLAPEWRIELSSAPTRVRLGQVASGDLDAAFVRGVEEGCDDAVRVVPMWQDALVVALSAGHPAAAAAEVELRDLAALPLSLTPRANNPPLVDLVVGACRDAGFEPVPGPSHSTLQDTLASFGAGAAGWTILYAAHARQLATGSVRFLPIKAPTAQDGAAADEPLPTTALTITTGLAVRRDAAAERLGPLFEACRAAGRDDRES
jgi:DNA-binding transcriptional LysR family regulator